MHNGCHDKDMRLGSSSSILQMMADDLSILDEDQLADLISRALHIVSGQTVSSTSGAKRPHV